MEMYKNKQIIQPEDGGYILPNGEYDKKEKRFPNNQD